MEFSTYAELFGILTPVLIMLMGVVKSKLVPNFINKEHRFYSLIMIWINIILGFGIGLGTMIFIDGLEIRYCIILSVALSLNSIGGYEIIVNNIRPMLNKKIL